MTRPVQRTRRSQRRRPGRRPAWVGWPVAATAVAFASIALATGISNGGSGVSVPPAIKFDAGSSTGPTSVPRSTIPAGRSTSAITSAVDPATPTSVAVTHSATAVPRTALPDGSSPTSGSSPTAAETGQDGTAEQGDSPTTVAPFYPLVTTPPSSPKSTGAGDS